MNLRKANVQDAWAIADIHTSARREAMPWLPALNTGEETLDWVTNVVLPNQDVWVAEADGQVVGYVSFEGVELNDLYVRPDVQGAGVGSALLARAKDLSPGELSLWTFQRNEKARRFYENRAFAAVEFTDGSGNEEGEPDVRYRWTDSQS